MGVMNKMRESTGVVLWILVIAFGVIFMLQDTNVFDVIGSTGNAIAQVNGSRITLDEYNGTVNARVEAYRQQTGESIPPQLLDTERDRIFEQLVDDRLREQEMNRLGIVVTDDEVRDMVLGENPHQLIKVYFSDGQGGVDRALLQNFIEDPDASQDLVRIEDYLRRERRREKLDKLIDATVRVSDEDIRDEYFRRNRRMDARYVALSYASIPDSVAEVTGGDLRDFYSDNRREFSRKRSYELEYVLGSKAASVADSAAIREELQNLRGRFQQAEDDSAFLAQHFSDRQYSDAMFRRDELDDEIAEAVFDNVEVGRVVGPIISGGQMHLVKIVSFEPADEKSIKARHILIRAPQDDEAQKSEARAEAIAVRDRIRAGEDFATVALEVSDDRASAANGGELGWFGPGRMVKPFEDAALAARPGQIVGPVETQFGFHVIEVLAVADRSVQVADFAQEIRPSVETLTRVEENLDDLLYFAEESGSFAEEATRRGLTVQTVLMEEDQEFVPGIGNSRMLLTFLQAADEGDLSPVIELNDNFLVASVSLITDEGYRPFEEVRTEIEPRVLREKKQEIQVEKIRAAKTADDLEVIGSQIGVPVRTVTAISAANPVVSGLGREPAFVGTALGLVEGEMSDVVAGQNSAFVLVVTSSVEPSPITESERSSIRQQLENQQRSQVRSRWIASLREKADITDNRRYFYQ